MTVRVGFIGAGGIARHHMEALSKIPAAKMVAFADIREEAAADVAATYGGTAFGDWRKMLADVALDAVYVCVPPDAHGDMEIEAARRGLHLFVEKPVNIDVGKATKIADAIDKAGVLAAAGYSLRYFPFYDQLKAVLKDLRVRQAVVTRWGSVPKAPWWRKMASSGGQLVEMVTHQIDLLRALVGEVVTVSAAYTYDRLEAEGADVPSHYNVVMQHEGGAGTVLSTSCASPAGRNDMVLMTPKAVLEVNYSKGVAVRPEGAVALPELQPGPSIDESFIRAVETKDKSLVKSDYRDAVRSLAVSLACNLSARKGKVVAVKELLGKGKQENR